MPARVQLNRGAAPLCTPRRPQLTVTRHDPMLVMMRDAPRSSGTYALEPQRWTQLVLLSLLALLSDWVCFSTAAVPGEWMAIEGHEASQLIDIFLFSNVVSCFLYTDLAAVFGLRKVILFAAWLMTAGCVLRSGLPVPGSADALARSMPGYSLEVVGTIMVGAAQPFFQCSPPLLSATWFGSSERALATATAIVCRRDRIIPPTTGPISDRTCRALSSRPCITELQPGWDRNRFPRRRPNGYNTSWHACLL